jgi:hypothetical protein
MGEVSSEAASNKIFHRDAVELLLLDVVIPRKKGKEAYNETKR